MSDQDEKEETSVFSKLKTHYESLPAEVKGASAFLAMFLLFLPTALIFTPLILERHCWELQTKNNKIFKFNTCTGDIIEITEKYLEKARVMSERQN